MKKILLIVCIALTCNIAIAQKDTTAIYQKADKLIEAGDAQSENGDYNKAVELYTQAAELTKNINKGNNTHYAKALYNIGYIYYASEDYNSAMNYYLQALTIYKDIIDVKDPIFSELLNNIAIIYFEVEDYPNALKFFMLVKDIRKEFYGEEHADYISTLYNIAISYFYNNDMSNALKYFIQVYDIRKKTLGENDPKCIDLLNTICKVSSSIGDNANSLKYLLQYADIQKKNNGTDNYDYATLLFDIGNVYSNMGQHQNALRYFNQGKEIINKVLGPEDKNYAAALNYIGNEYSYLGDNQKALESYLKELEIDKKAYGTNHTSYAATLYNIGCTYMDLGDYQNSLKYHLQAIEIRKKLLGDEDPNYAASLSNTGVIYNRIGDYQNALKYHNLALKVKEKAFGKEHTSYASTLNNIGSVYKNMSDYQTALKYYMQAMEIYRKAEHPDYAMTLNNIGQLFNVIKNYQYALEYYTKAMEIWKKYKGTNSQEYSMALNNIGVTYSKMGDHQKALKYFSQSMELNKKLYGDKHNEYATSIYNIGGEYSDLGDKQNALKYYMQAKEIWKITFGENHPDYASTINNIGIIYKDMGDYKNALSANVHAFNILKNNLIRNFSFMTAHERESYWYKNYQYFSRVINDTYHLPDDNIATETTYDNEIISKGLLLASEINITNIIKESGNTALIAEYEKMKDMNMRLNKALEMPIVERKIDCDSLEDEVKKLERHIIENCNNFGDITNFLKISWKDIQNSMKANDVAIEFTNFTEKDTTRYMALVLTKNMEAPVCIPLFEQSEMQKLQRGVASQKIERQQEEKEENRGATSVSAKKQGIYESTGLYNMIWKPMEKYFPTNPRIYFAPTGMLHQIAIEYAPVNHENIISDKYEIYRVSSTRYLAMDYMPKPMKNSVLYGGIYYDCDTITMKTESARYSTRSAEISSFASLNQEEYREGLAYLPGTKTEVENIVGELQKKKIKTTLHEGTSANEESFKALSGSDISCLHIATHGFFIHTDEDISGDNSLVQSGLLLSGANFAWRNIAVPQGVEDGILTAKEISYMDLRKTDLVVLSACQTALGEINSEGVYGLQRGFKKAGVKTIIMSLWPVDDNATLLMMTEFYSNMAKGMSKREAFLAAQNKVKTTPGFENPRFWAAFIMLDGNE